MLQRLQLRSIQWKLVTAYLLLILLSMEFIGVYLLQSLERYYFRGFADNLYTQARGVGLTVQKYLESQGDDPRGDISRAIQELRPLVGAGMVIIDADSRVLAAVPAEEFTPGTVVKGEEVSRALMGQRAQAIRVDPRNGERQLFLAVPVEQGGRVLGVVYLVSSLEDTYRTLGAVRGILFSATLVALLVTAALGSALARTITGPIQEVTARAAQMAGGDFDRQIEVRSQDEIGRLASMFNHLTLRLKETLREISGEKRKMEAVVTHMADGLLALDGEGRVILINPAAARMLGVDTGEILGRAPAEALPGVDLTLPGENRPLTRELAVEHPRHLVLRARFAPFTDEGGRPGGTVIVLQDITEQERLQALRREFVANVSHELRTPLTTIKSYVETLLDGAVADRPLAEKFLEVVASETDRMVRLVSDLLQLSQLDYHQVEWDKSSVHLPDLVGEAVSKLSLLAEKKGLELKCSFQEDLPMVEADRDRIQQVLLNLIGNAIEFTPGGGKIGVHVRRQDGFIVVEVRDTGIGIPADDLPRIFDRFYRVDKARSRELGGTGLGLAIAREIIEAHGGGITLESEEGRGTSVAFTLPLAGGEATCWNR